MSRIEEVIKMIYRSYRERGNQASSGCPDEEALTCFLEGKLNERDSKGIQEHLVSCHRCAKIASLFHLHFESEKEPPEYLVKKAKDLIKQEAISDIFEVILALKEKTLEIIKTTGDIVLENEIIPAPILRSRKISEFAEEISLIKEFKDIKINLCINKIQEDKVRIRIELSDRVNLKPLSDLRLTLLRGGQEVESYDSESGKAVFDKVSFGSYSIEIARKDIRLGIIKLEIK